ncbi:MAG: ABC transporter permease [Muribaculaceae bacterium]|nr:ABC transporter permease [Muribaculaceae bacterium]
MKLIIRTIKDALKTPGFSLLYIGGVAVTIAFTVVYGIILYGQLGPVYPEYNRTNTYYIDTTIAKDGSSIGNTGLGLAFIDEFLRDSIPSIESMTAMTRYESGAKMVETNGRCPEFHVNAHGVEPSFFNFYKYEFLAGEPFSRADFEAGDKVAVISDKVARRLFDSPDEAIGESMSIDHVRFRIAGVFREGSALCPDSYGEVFYPYSILAEKSKALDANDAWHAKYMGNFKAIIKAKSGKGDELRKSINEICRRINLVDTTAAKFYIPFIRSHTEHVLSENRIDYKKDSYEVETAKTPLQLCKSLLIGLFVVLIIPALNISGLISARMDRMRADIGVRRCFGAPRYRLMAMVMNENLILTVIGGFAGMIAAWIMILCAGDRLLKFMPLELDWGISINRSASIITGEMAFAPVLFIAVFLICLILNTISAWIPARIAMHRQITESINSKR